MKKILAIILAMCCILPAAAKKRQSEEIITPLTQLEKRQFQTKTYATQDNIAIMKSILNVLQDEGFIVYNVNSLLGYIYGVKDFDLSDPNIDISKEFGVTKSRLNYNGVKVATLEVGVNIMQYGQNSRVRVNFKRKLLNEYGNAQMIEDISDIQYYEDFYNKVNSALNIQKQIEEKIKNVSNKQVLPPIADPLEPEQEQQVETSEINDNTKEVKPVEQLQGLQEVQEAVPVAEPQITETPSASESIDASENTELKNEPQEPIVQDTKTLKREAKELKKQEKREAKQAKQDAKIAEKETKLAQKQAAKELKQAQKDAKISQKEAEKQYKQAQKQEKKEAKRQAKEKKD